MSMSKFATFADYQASTQPVDKTVVYDRLQAMTAQLQAEAQQKKEAALWRKFAKVNPITAEKLAAMWANEQ